MRHLLHCRRGSAAFATVIALVPLIGVVALGAEAGSWYVTRQHAQNAADSAAYSGALRLACTIAGAAGPGCDTSVDYYGKQFAAQNAFCNAGDTAYPGTNCALSLPTGISHDVQIAIGDYDAGTFTTPAAGNGNAVRARVSQQQPAYLAAVLGLTTVNIPAQAIALIQNPTKLCALALGPDSGALKLAGNLSNNGTGCGIMSDSTVQFASTPSFTGSGWAVLGAFGCTPSSTCSNPGVPHNYFMPYATNPLSKLDSETFNSATTGSPADPCPSNPCTISSNSPTTAYGNLTVTTGKSVTFASGGTFFFYNAAIKINAGTVTGTSINIVLLGDSSISITGGTVSLSANMSNTSYPDLSGVLIDDQAPRKSKNSVTVNGGGTVALGGAMYFPHVDVTWSGSIQNTNTTCSEVIAETLNMSGGAYLSTQGCAPATVAHSQVVTLVQ
jgi:Flp pilus assembly protein TadG